MMLIILIGIAAILAVIFWEGEEEESSVKVYDVFPDVKEEIPQIKPEGLTPLTCKCCGGTIDRETLTCKYCKTEYII